MSPTKVVFITVLVGAVSVAAALYGKHWLDGEGDMSLPLFKHDDQLHSLPEMQLSTPAGEPVSSTSWAGKVVVMNFWATWCPPCLREMPLFIRTQAAYADSPLTFVGVAIDRPEAVRAFIAEHPVNFPILIGGTDAVDISRRLGNRLQALPFTVIFDQHGRRVLSHPGEVSRETLKEQVTRLLPDAPASRAVGQKAATSEQNL